MRTRSRSAQLVGVGKRLMSLFNTTVEWFVPEGLAEQNPEEHRRARLSVVLLLALFPMNPIAATTYALLGLDVFVWPVLSCGLLMAACPFIIRATGSYKLGGAIALINLMAAITLISLHTGGLNSPVLWWITPIPLLVGTVLGRTHATAWTLSSIAMVVLIALFAVFPAVPTLSFVFALGLIFALWIL